MTKFRGDRSKSYSAHSIQYFALAMGDRRLSSKALDLWLLAVCSCLLTLLCHSLTHPSSLPNSVSRSTSTPASTATPNSSPIQSGGQRAPQLFIPAKSSAPDQELKSDADE